MAKFGRLQINDSELKDIKFEEVEKKYPHIKKALLKGAWDIANPKGVKAPKEEK